MMKKVFIIAIAFISLFSMSFSNPSGFNKKTETYTGGNITDIANSSVANNPNVMPAIDTVTRSTPAGAVDLGLSVYWAECNLGASVVEEFGDYYAWGEIETKKEYSWSNYRWCKGTNNTLTKYNYKSESGVVDNNVQLDLVDDAAHVKLGGAWRMPTYEEWDELRKNCIWTKTVHNDVPGYSVTSNINGNSIFLPAGGSWEGEYRFGAYSRGSYWASTLSMDFPHRAWVYQTYFNTDGRCIGSTIRPVLEKNTPTGILETNEVSNSPQNLDLGNLVNKDDRRDMHEAVDLGLSVKWAHCNLGASKEEEYGDYYAWGEIETKEDYSWNTYRLCNGSDNTLTKYNFNKSYGVIDKKGVLEKADDIASYSLGEGWRIPTDAEWTELREKCSWTWTKINGMSGYLVTSTNNGNSIFLPATGYRYNNSLYDAGSGGEYWSSSLNVEDSFNYPYYSWRVYFNSLFVRRGNNYRYMGHTIRPVKE